MKPTLKHLVLVLALILTGGGTLSAQHRGGGGLPKILDPLGILPTPKQVLRSLDHVGRSLPPVAIDTRYARDFDDDRDYPRFRTRHACEAAPGHRVYAEIEPLPRRHVGRGYRSERYEHRGRHFQMGFFGHGPQRYEGRR